METIIKPIKVACRCGWEGDQRNLASTKESENRYCPACGRLFKKVPPFSSEHDSVPLT